MKRSELRKIVKEVLSEAGRDPGMESKLEKAKNDLLKLISDMAGKKLISGQAKVKLQNDAITLFQKIDDNFYDLDD